MKFAISPLAVAFLLTLSTATPLIASQLAPAVVGDGARTSSAEVLLAAFGDGPPTAPRHGRRARSADIPKPIEPSHADMNGATRESADKAYRKKYGF